MEKIKEFQNILPGVSYQFITWSLTDNLPFHCDPKVASSHAKSKTVLPITS